MGIEYWSCPWIEGGILFRSKKIQPCSVDNLKKGDNYAPIITEWDGKELPLERILEFRKLARSEMEEGGFSFCKGCGRRSKEYWEPSPYLFNHIHVAHFKKCNLRCTYCEKVHVVTDWENEIIPLYPIIDKMLEDGLVAPNAKVFFGGGEPTLLNEFESLVNLLNQHNMMSVVSTNGIVFSNAIVNALKENNITLLISIDASSKETYKKVKGADAYERVWGNLKKYIAFGAPVNLKMIIGDYNLTEVEAFVNKAASLRNVTLVCDVDHRRKEIEDSVVEAISKFINQARKQNISIRTGIGIKLAGPGLQNRIDEFLGRL